MENWDIFMVAFIVIIRSGVETPKFLVAVDAQLVAFNFLAGQKLELISG